MAKFRYKPSKLVAALHKDGVLIDEDFERKLELNSDELNEVLIKRVIEVATNEGMNLYDIDVLCRRIIRKIGPMTLMERAYLAYQWECDV